MVSKPKNCVAVRYTRSDEFLKQLIAENYDGTIEKYVESLIPLPIPRELLDHKSFSVFNKPGSNGAVCEFDLRKVSIESFGYQSYSESLTFAYDIKSVEDLKSAIAYYDEVRSRLIEKREEDYKDRLLHFYEGFNKSLGSLKQYIDELENNKVKDVIPSFEINRVAKNVFPVITFVDGREAIYYKFSNYWGEILKNPDLFDELEDNPIVHRTYKKYGIDFNIPSAKEIGSLLKKFLMLAKAHNERLEELKRQEEERRHKEVFESWIEAHGSEKLKRLYKNGLPWQVQYRKERAKYEFGQYIYYPDSEYEWEVLSENNLDTERTVTEEVLGIYEDLQKNYPTYKLNLVLIYSIYDDDGTVDEPGGYYCIEVRPDWSNKRDYLIVRYKNNKGN